MLTVTPEARRNRQGLWSLPESQRLPPWEWRHPSHAQTPPAPLEQGRGGFTCAGKKVCRQMTSCEEARFYLQHCGVSSLDGNHDGIPCSNLCRN
ncbi:MAG: excalibur calcium-binding domain-containing protein [Limisphaerales bacterium]